MGKIKHRVDRSGKGVEGAAADPLSLQPIVFDEAQNGGLIGQTMVDKVVPRKGRNHQQRQPRPIAAPALGMIDGRSGKRGRSIAALPCPG